MDEADLLLMYSEWLDGEGLVIPEVRNTLKTDIRTHSELVKEFLQYKTELDDTNTLDAALEAFEDA